MGDFFQNGVITTFQELGDRSYERYEADLVSFSKVRPLALVLPSLFSEFESQAMPKILKELHHIRYIRKLVVSLGAADQEQFSKAKNFFNTLDIEVKVIWNDGRRISNIKSLMRDNNLYLGDAGKGLAAWMAYGYVMSDPSIRVIALHDCDILTYDRILLHRLVYPIMNPMLDYEFCKGYYARAYGKLYGRATRIFVTPIVRALQKMLGMTPFLNYLDSFRYPLAGEFAMNIDVARINRIPSDWGLEVGTLAEVFRNYSTRRVCQVDLGIQYEHKHQISGIDDQSKGLMKMAREISLALFHSLAAEGEPLPTSFFRSLRASYLRCSQDAIRQYSDLANINGLEYDRHSEDMLAESFVKAIEAASEEFLSNPFGSPQIRNWNSVVAAMPDVLEQLREAVDEDNNQ